MIFGNVLHTGQIEFTLIIVFKSLMILDIILIYNVQTYDKLNPVEQRNDLNNEHEIFESKYN